MKNIKITYWTLTIIFAALMILDGIGGVTQQQEGQAALRQLGYPIYLMCIIGTAKILGAMALVQNKFSTLKEWAFAGFAFNFIGASLSWAFSGGQVLLVLIPLVMLVFMALVYYFWKRFQETLL